MRTNNYGQKAQIYAQHRKDEGTLLLAYNVFGTLFDKHVTSGANNALDFGSGAGRSRKYLSDLGFNADGVDIDENMIAQAKHLDKGSEDKYQLIIDSVLPH